MQVLNYKLSNSIDNIFLLLSRLLSFLLLGTTVLLGLINRVKPKFILSLGVLHMFCLPTFKFEILMTPQHA